LRSSPHSIELNSTLSGKANAAKQAVLSCGFHPEDTVLIISSTIVDVFKSVQECKVDVLSSLFKGLLACSEQLSQLYSHRRQAKLSKNSRQSILLEENITGLGHLQEVNFAVLNQICLNNRRNGYSAQQQQQQYMAPIAASVDHRYSPVDVMCTVDVELAIVSFVPALSLMPVADLARVLTALSFIANDCKHIFGCLLNTCRYFDVAHFDSPQINAFFFKTRFFLPLQIMCFICVGNVCYKRSWTAESYPSAY
jgi:hypothetical protein